MRQTADRPLAYFAAGTTTPTAGVLIVALCYAAVAQAVYLTASLPGHISPVFPSAGIALAAVLILGRPALAGVWLGSLLANLIPEVIRQPIVAPSGLWIACAVAVGAMAGAGTGAYLVRRLCADRYPLSCARDLFVLLIFGVLAACAISPTVGVAVLCSVGITPWNLFGYSWLTWWLGDAVGATLAAPLILAWMHRGPGIARSGRSVEGLLLAVAILVLCDLAFFRGLPVEYALMPMLVLAAFRFGMRGATAAAAGVAVLATFGTAQGSSHLASGSVNQSLLVLHSFLGVNVVSALLLAVVLEERRKAEHDLRRARDEAEAASRAKDHFLAAASHELRTPLTPIMLLASSLEKDQSLPPEARQDLAVVREQVELEKRLVDDLLDFAAIHSGKVQLRLRQASLNAIVQAAIATCESEIGRRELRLEVAGLAAADTVVADPDRLRQVFWNILQNAAKFTPRGGSITVVTSNDRPGEVSVQVADTGSGIDPQTKRRLFVPFEQGPRAEVQHYGGLGLGLAIAHELTEQHKGSIEAESEGLGRGATFTVRLPLAPAAYGEQAKAGSGQGPSSETVVRPEAAGRLRILLVEDHEQTRTVLARLLATDRHCVTAVAGVADALAVAEGQRFDVVLSDVGLPDGSGLDLMRQLRERHGLRGIALSGFSSDADREAARDAGFTVHLAKPVLLDALRQALLRATESQSSDRRFSSSATKAE